jgi:hypothetical protein
MITTTIISFFILFDRSAISLPKAQRLFRQSAAIIERDTSVKLRARRFTRIRGAPAIMLQHQRFALGIYSSYFTRSEHTVLLAPPGRSDYQPEIEYAVGQATICGNRGYIGVVRKGHWKINVIGLAHEMGHMLGAEHTPDDDSLMNPMPALTAYFRDWKTYLAGSTRDDIANCIQPTLSTL